MVPDVRAGREMGCCRSAIQALIQAVQSELTAVGRVGAWGAAGVGAVGGGGVFGGVGVGLQEEQTDGINKCVK